MTEESVKKTALATEYWNIRRKQIEKIRGSLTNAQRNFLFYPEDGIVRLDAALQSAMKDPSTVPSEYIAMHLDWMFGEAIPSYDREVVLYFADRLRDYPYSDSWSRRTFRSPDQGDYVEKLKSVIRAHVNPVVDAPAEAVLSGEIPEGAQAYLDKYPHYVGYTEWEIAYALDTRNAKVEEAVTRILTEENGSGRMTRSLIEGVLFSHRSDFHELVGKLLLAARLQEGLRQVICESADRGTKEAFLTILKVIADNDLIRFSAVKRAVGTWLGIMTEESRDLDRVSAKSVRLIIECLESEEARREYLASEDAMQIYIALWSYGVDDITESVRRIKDISENGSRHQLLVAGYFVTQIELPGISHKTAATVLKRHHDKEDVLAVWLPSFLKNASESLWDIWRKNAQNTPVGSKIVVNYGDWFTSAEELSENYLLLKTIYGAFSGKSKTFSPCVFPWHEAKLEKSQLSEYICNLAALSGETEKIDEACGYIKDCTNRNFLYTKLLELHPPKTEIQRKTALEGIVDKEQYTRSTVFRIVNKMTLTPTEYRSIEEYLRFKSADIRKFVLSLLMKQNDGELTACIARLLADKKEDIRLGGLDLIAQLKKDGKRSALADGFTSALAERAREENLPSKEKLLLESLLPEEKEAKQEEKSLYSPSEKYLPKEFDEEYIELCLKTFAEYFPESALPDAVRGMKAGGVIDRLRSALRTPCPTSITAASDLLSLSRLIEAHKTDSFEWHNGGTMLLGNITFPHMLTDMKGKPYLTEMWDGWVKDNGITNRRLLAAMILFLAYVDRTKFAEAAADDVRAVFGEGFVWGKTLPHAAVMSAVLPYLVRSLPKKDMTRLACALAAWFLRCVPDDRVMLKSPDPNRFGFSVRSGYAHLPGHRQLHLIYQFLRPENNEELKSVFPLAVAFAERCIEAYRKCPKPKENDGRIYYRSDESARYLQLPSDDYHAIGSSFVGVKEYLFAAFRGVITEPQLYEFLLHSDNIRGALSTVTAVASNYYEKGKQIASHDTYSYAWRGNTAEAFLGKKEPDESDAELIRFVARVYETIVPEVLSVELSRGDTPTRYSSGISAIARVYGADIFARLLESIGSDSLDRSASGWGDQRKSTLSYLLSKCIPLDTDTVETLRTALAGKNIPGKRLIEAALFSPEWIPLIGQYLGIEGFESVCYYFMAHMNEKFDDKRKAMIARFTPLSEDELNLGAFDVNWFRSAYASIGEKEFDLIYDAAKYITDGAKHSRARKYADAALGRFDIGETEKTVSDKRNKDLLMAYALIPIADEDDICRRYLYLQRFRKESKQFGSQRIASENKAVETALTNLAINAGYSDTMRLTLRMETKVIDDSRALLEEQTVEDVTLKIVLDENGKASLTASKGGKALKSVPAKIKKHETTVALTELVKTLTEQYRRTRLMLERAMEDRTVFSFAELSALSAHPVVYPMLKNLVLVSDGAVGFLAEGGLRDTSGEVNAVNCDAEIRIAHPFDLYERGCWRDFQKHLYEHTITQPFRQVFRELYIKTAEEMNLHHSLRYAGNQIQPAKTVGALKSRRWVADIEDGLQKVYYKENIVAQIYALADWFSPADIEAPTLEWVCFTDRKTGEEMRIADIPDVVFSEVMRDVDLAVSVAHAGGVDPETSHSTMEMRAAILSFVLPMFRINNVKVEGHHAIIEGKLAEYSVHLGSGVVHQLGGAMIPVLPVHSQHRGKIFLPFVDDDPKTAEIISKVLLFAEDGKIKDPSILSMISR